VDAVSETATVAASVHRNNALFRTPTPSFTVFTVILSF
jgi:hypothetical protein